MTEIASLIAIAIAIMLAVKLFKSDSIPLAKVKRTYFYKSRMSIMTQAEASFFKRLEDIAGDKYYIFPQIHLSSLLDHRIKGQNWKGALSTIQRKSVDYVLCDKTTLKPMYAVELDDWSHDKDDRIARDSLVEQILLEAKVPLVRFRNPDGMTDGDIEQKFIEASQR